MRNHCLTYQLQQTLFIITTIMLIVSCGSDKQTRAMLEKAEEMCETNPDSAYQLLKNYSDDIKKWNKSDRMYYKLLSIKLSDKCDSLNTNEQDILDIVKYYEKRNNKHLLSNAYYYAGRIFYDRQEFDQALPFFLKAIDNAESNDYHLKSVANSQCGYVFMYQDLYNEGEKCFKESLRNDSLNNDTIGIIYDIRDIATVHESNGDYRKAIDCLLKAHKICQSQNDLSLMHSVEAYLASVYTKIGEYNHAKKYLSNSLKEIQHSDSSSIYSVAMNLYEAMHNDDSTAYYSKRLESVGKIYAKESAYKNMTRINLRRGNITEANRCFEQFLIFSDSIRNITATENVARINSLYKIQKKENENQRLRNEKQRLIFFLILAFLSIIILYLMYRDNRNKKREAQFREKELYEKYSTLRIAKDEMELLDKIKINESEKIINDKKIYVENLEEQVSKLKEALNVQTITHNEEKLLNSPTVLRLQQMAQIGKSASSEDWKDLHDAFNADMSDFINGIRAKYPQIRNTELNICLLIRTKFSMKEISNLTGISLQYLSMIRSRLSKKIFQTDGGAKDFDRLLFTI